jgi:SAM-dependent methyltransferase
LTIAVEYLPVRTCGLCGGGGFRRRWTLEGFDIGECVECGLVQVMQAVDVHLLETLYDKEYYEGGCKLGYQDYLANQPAKREYFRNRLLDVMKANGIGEPGRCLEVGCAFGLCLDEARSLGWKVRGTEVSQHSAEYARSHLGIEVDASPTALDNVEAASQDLVLMWDVIEHLIEPLKMLQEVKRILAPGGLLVLSTGDVGSVGARLYGRRWFLLAPPHHLFYFDRRSITRMLEAAGFTQTRIVGEGHPLENMGKYPVLQWLARHDRYLGWRLNSGPIMTVTARG